MPGVGSPIREIIAVKIQEMWELSNHNFAHCIQEAAFTEQDNKLPLSAIDMCAEWETSKFRYPI